MILSFQQKTLELITKSASSSILYASIKNVRLFSTTGTVRKTVCSTDEALSFKTQNQHYNLSSFLEYAARTKLDVKSNVYVGTHYEYTVQSAFEKMGMSLKRIGGRDDYGTDIIGKWPVPSAPYPLRVLIQCKAHAGKVNPAHARELEGAFVGASIGKNGPGVLGLLVSPNSASKGVRETLGRSRWPMGFALCTVDGKIMQMMWNRSAAERDLAGIECGLRYSGGNVKQREIVLTWRGKAIH